MADKTKSEELGDVELDCVQGGTDYNNTFTCIPAAVHTTGSDSMQAASLAYASGFLGGVRVAAGDIND